MLLPTVNLQSNTDELFTVSAEAGLHHRVLLPPTRPVFHYDRSVAAEIVELTLWNVLNHKLLLLFLTTRKAAWCIILVMSVCLYVCQTITVESLDVRSSYLLFAHVAYLHALWVKFICEGHRVKVTVTGAKKVENSYSGNVKLPLAITPVLSNIQSRDVCVQHGVFRYGRSNGVTAVFVTWLEVNTCNFFFLFL